MKYFFITIFFALALINTAPLHAETGDATARGYTTAAAPTDTGSTAPGNISYTPLEPIPGFIQTGTPNFGAFLGSLFKILLSLGALLAVGRMVVGGIMYMTSEVMETKGDAKRWMTSSLYGLLLLAGSWLILYTINPNLLNFNLTVGNSSVTPNDTSKPNGTNTGNAAVGGGNTKSLTYLSYCVPGRALDYYPSVSTTDELNQCSNMCTSKGGHFTQTANGSDSAGSYTTYSCK